MVCFCRGERSRQYLSLYLSLAYLLVYFNTQYFSFCAWKNISEMQRCSSFLNESFALRTKTCISVRLDEFSKYCLLKLEKKGLILSQNRHNFGLPAPKLMRFSSSDRPHCNTFSQEIFLCSQNALETLCYIVILTAFSVSIQVVLLLRNTRLLLKLTTIQASDSLRCRVV